MKLFKYLAANYFNWIGGLLIGISMPIGESILNNHIQDIVVFWSMGILLFGISYYYKFIDK